MGNPAKKNSAVFLDRDGTINEEVGYLSRLDELKLIAGTPEAIRLINEAGMKVVVITNQSGVARGYFSEDFVETVHRRINEILREQGARIDRFYFCPHHPVYGNGPYKIACSCRKPESGLFLRASEELDINLSRSYVVGDMLKDIDAGKRVGARGVLVRTGYGQNISQTDKPVYIAEDVLDAVKWILQDRGK